MSKFLSRSGRGHPQQPQLTMQSANDVSADETSPLTTLEHTPEGLLSVSLEPSEEDLSSLSLDDGAGPGIEGKSPRTVGEPERKPAHHSDYKNTAHGDTSLAAVLQPRNTRQFVTDDGGEPKRKGLTSKQWLLCVSALSFASVLLVQSKRARALATRWRGRVPLATSRPPSGHNLRGVSTSPTQLATRLGLRSAHYGWGVGGDIEFLWRHRAGVRRRAASSDDVPEVGRGRDARTRRDDLGDWRPRRESMMTPLGESVFSILGDRRRRRRRVSHGHVLCVSTSSLHDAHARTRVSSPPASRERHRHHADAGHRQVSGGVVG